MKRIFCLALLFLWLLCGCSQLSDSLLSLPRTEESREVLPGHALSLLTGSAAYTVPLSGDTTRSVTTIDLDGDGEEETVTCLFRRRDGAMRPCVEVSAPSADGNALLARFFGDGEDIAALRFPQIDADGARAVVVSWSLSGSSLHGLTAAAFREDRFETFFEGICRESAVLDLDRDGAEEIVFVRDAADGPEAVLLDCRDGVWTASQPAPLSVGIRLSGIAAANIGFDRAALLCDGTVENFGYVTDVILCSEDGTLQNLYRSGTTGVSEVTARAYPIPCMDLNRDGTLEFPLIAEGDASVPSEYVPILWCRCDGLTSPEPLYMGYWNPKDGWCVRLPEAGGWTLLPAQSVRTDTVSATLFYSVDAEGGRGSPVWELYYLTGEDAAETERLLGLTRLAVTDGCIYAYQFYTAGYGSLYQDAGIPAFFTPVSVQDPAAQGQITRNGGTI